MILVVGATGTVGRKVIDNLLEIPGQQVRTLARGKSDWQGSFLPGFRRRGVDVITGDIRSEKAVERAVRGCKAIINCAGVMRSTPEDDLHEVNVEGVQNLIDQGKAAGVQRFIQLSCLGATEHATNQYFGAKWDAEELVTKSGMLWTIFRPSLIFGPDSSLYRILDFWVQRSPIIVMVGSGLNRFQPISADDVARCISQSVYERDTVKKIYDLVGPDTLDLYSLLGTIAEYQGRPVSALKIPSFIGVPLFGLLGKLNPKCPIDNNVMSVMTSDMIGDEAPMLAKFQLERQKFKKSLREIGMSEGGSDAEDEGSAESGDDGVYDLGDEESSATQDTPEAEAEAEAPKEAKPKKPPMNFKRKI